MSVGYCDFGCRILVRYGNRGRRSQFLHWECIFPVSRNLPGSGLRQRLQIIHTTKQASDSQNETANRLQAAFEQDIRNLRCMALRDYTGFC